MWPLGAALRGEASSRLRLRWLKTVVVSDEEKAHVMRQAGTWKTTTGEASEELLDDIGTGAVSVCSGISLAGARLLAGRCPAQRWREPGLRLLMRNVGRRARKLPSQRRREGEPGRVCPAGTLCPVAARRRTGPFAQTVAAARLENAVEPIFHLIPTGTGRVEIGAGRAG